MVAEAFSTALKMQSFSNQSIGEEESLSCSDDSSALSVPSTVVDDGEEEMHAIQKKQEVSSKKKKKKSPTETPKAVETETIAMAQTDEMDLQE